MTSAPVAPHMEFSQFHAHPESGHEDPHGHICDGINNSALHFLQHAAHVKKSFPEAERHQFYVDLHKEVTAAHNVGHKFNETLAAQGVKYSDVVLAMEGEQIAVIAMFDTLKAADPKYEEHCAHIETSLKAIVQGAIDMYSKA